MARIQLTLIGGPHEWVRPLFDGTVQPEGMDLIVTRSPPPEAMRRQLSTWEFDISEMAFGAYLVARAKGADIVAIPAFPMRGFFHTNFACHVDANINHPGDLANKRVGIAEYVQSACLWARGILQHDFGMDPYHVQWYAERSGAESTGTVLGFVPPKGIALQQIPAGKNLVSMLVARELDAAMVGRIPQTTTGKESGSNVRPMFPDLIAEGKRFFDRHGYIPANHTYVIRGEVLRKYPGVAVNLYYAFQEAKAVVQQSLPQRIPSGLVFGAEHLAREREIFGDDPFRYGVAPNREMLETVVQFSQEQGLIHERPTIEQLFAVGTAELG
jgi:4,5-dihydroxyphthalate decarboxylase